MGLLLRVLMRRENQNQEGWIELYICELEAYQDSRTNQSFMGCAAFHQEYELLVKSEP